MSSFFLTEPLAILDSICAVVKQGPDPLVNINLIQGFVGHPKQHQSVAVTEKHMK